jgi:hypothetical protein
MKVLVSLIGEQIIPNLLPLKYFKPDISLAVFSAHTKKGYERLQKITEHWVKLIPCEVDAYKIDAIQPALLDALEKWDTSRDVVFNITGGTKPMSIAAYLAAAQLNAPMIYFQTEGKRSRVLRYEFQDGEPVMIGDYFLPAVITLDEYLQAHVELSPPRQQRIPDVHGHRFENDISEVLSGVVDEIKMRFYLQGIVEIDMAVRCENQVGIIEVKTGTNGIKSAIDQLSDAGEQRYLGTYTQKFLITDRDLSGLTDLKKLADAHHIIVIELPNYERERILNPVETGLLRAAILKGLGKTS